MKSALQWLALWALVGVVAWFIVGRAYDSATDPFRAHCQDGVCITPTQQPPR